MLLYIILKDILKKGKVCPLFASYGPTGAYHYYTMCTLQDMGLNQEFNQSVMDGQTYERMDGQG